MPQKDKQTAPENKFQVNLMLLLLFCTKQDNREFPFQFLFT